MKTRPTLLCSSLPPAAAAVDGRRQHSVLTPARPEPAAQPPARLSCRSRAPGKVLRGPRHAEGHLAKASTHYSLLAPLFALLLPACGISSAWPPEPTDTPTEQAPTPSPTATATQTPTASATPSPSDSTNGS